MMTVTAVDVRFGVPGVGVVVERYRLDHTGDLSAWGANARAWPQFGVASIEEDLTQDEVAAFRSRRLVAAAVARAYPLNLRVSAA